MTPGGARPAPVPAERPPLLRQCGAFISGAALGGNCRCESGEWGQLSKYSLGHRLPGPSPALPRRCTPRAGSASAPIPAASSMRGSPSGAWGSSVILCSDATPFCSVVLWHSFGSPGGDRCPQTPLCTSWLL